VADNLREGLGTIMATSRPSRDSSRGRRDGKRSKHNMELTGEKCQSSVATQLAFQRDWLHA
jgi:hypothetical protein